jgi:Ala-tRNA(Pro) deacylase
MPIAKKIIKFLSKIKYEPISHRTVYTAFDKAQTLRVPEKIVGKTLVIKMDGNFALVLISAHQILDKAKFKKIVNAWRKKLGQRPVKEIGFASEAWMKKNLKGVKVGAIPPFGNLWGLPTFAEKSLLNQSKIIINGGDYNSSIKISSASLKKLIPDLVIGSFGKVKK